MKEEHIKINTSDGNCFVFAEVYGLFAVHKHYIGDGKVGSGYTVTHIPSGLSVASFVSTKKIARFVVADLNRALQMGEIDSDKVKEPNSSKAAKAFPSYMVSFLSAAKRARRGEELQNFEAFRG